MSQNIPQEILEAFGLSIEDYTVTALSGGNINGTFKLEGENTYVLQSINTKVFKNPEYIDTNLRIVKEHLKTHHPEYLFPAPIAGKDGVTMVYDNTGTPWRLLPFVPNSESINTVPSREYAENAARGFARFTNYLHGIPLDACRETIPQFHDLTLREEQFKEAILRGIPDTLPEPKPYDPSANHAPGRKAILTKDHRGRPKCHHCGPCWLGCDSGSKFDSLRVLVQAAQRTGKLTLMPNSRVRSIELDKEGRASSVHYFDTVDRQWREVRAKVFVLGAGCIETSQILLNSRIANSSGLVGRYLSEHMYASLGGFLPQMMGRKVTNEDGNGAHIIIPDLTENWRGNKFIRGYQIFPTGGIGEFTFVGKQLAGFGQDWKKTIRDYYTAGASITFQGEVLPYKDNFIEVDDKLKDDAGIPGVRFHYKWRDNEEAMFQDMMQVGEEIFRKAGAEFTMPNNPRPIHYGHSIHYVGTARMGKDPKTSVLNEWNQSHDVTNLFVNDAAAFVTAGNQNPTLTILALAMRSSERIAERMKRREL